MGFNSWFKGLNTANVILLAGEWPTLVETCCLKIH